MVKLFSLLFWLTPPLVALGLYGSTLSLPFFWDDVANFQFMFGRSLAQIWIDSSGFPYYRPLTFVLWRILQLTFGPLNPLPFHALNILTLIACGWMVGALATQLTRDDKPGFLEKPGLLLTGWLVGVLMTVFPFAALVVPLVASLFHLFVTLLSVSACVCLLEFEQTQKRRWATLALLLAALAPFAHESGMAVAALMAVCLLIRLPNLQSLIFRLRSGYSSRQVSSLPSLFVVALSFLCNLAFLPWWAGIPKERPEGSFAWAGWESLGQSLIFFFEGLTFPIQFLARPLMAAGWSDIWAVTLLGLIAIAAAFALLNDRRWLMFGLGYGLLAALPALTALPFSYIIVSPRLMVVTAPAAAILWAMVIVGGTRRIASVPVRIGAAAAIAVAASIAPALHIVKEVRLHHLALDHLWSFVAEAKSHPAEKLLVVNPVNWIAPVQATYALGHEGVEVMPGYLTPQLMAWAHTQALYQVDGVTFPLIFPQLNDIYFSTWGGGLDWEAMAERVRSADRVALIRYADDQIRYEEVGRVLPATGKAKVSFEERIWLTDAQAALTSDAIELHLNWRVNAVSGEDIFANAADCAGNVLGLSGGAGMGGIYPIWLWQPGESIHEVRRIPLDAPSPDGCYRVGIGLFNPQTGERTPATNENGTRLDNDVFVLELNNPTP